MDLLLGVRADVRRAMTMKPTLEELQRACASVDPELVRNHLDRLGDDYFETYSVDIISQHLEALVQLSVDEPVKVLIDRQSDMQIECIVFAFDRPSMFSLITGLFAASGYSVVSGHVFTYAPAGPSGHRVARGRGRQRQAPATADLLRRRRIIDHFSGHVSAGTDVDQWAETFRRRLDEIIRFSDSNADIEKARHIVNEWVAAYLGSMEDEASPVLYPVDIDIDNARGPHTTLRVLGQDTPAFLYSMSNALALQGVWIERVRIETVGSRVEDELDVLDSREHKIEGQDAIDRLRLSMLLTKQFTYCLDKAPDPYLALSRFDRLSADVLALPDRGEWLELFGNPGALQDLATILGASDFLWEDFVRLQYESLLPVLNARLKGDAFTVSRDDLLRRLKTALAAAPDFVAKRQALNRFKDEEVYRIDLGHILQGAGDVISLSEQLTCLAEIVVVEAVFVVREELAKRFGTPRTAGGLDARLAVMGLGKMGGMALGYASDIELMFVYSDSGHTDGDESITNDEFFERLVTETVLFIKTKREGIFNVDLRLRPHGDSGPKACSLDLFCRYYTRGGPAHSIEKLALVRLRAIAGDRELGMQIERIRNSYIYSGRAIDTGELFEVRERQFEQKVKGSRLNAKLSPGGLVDVEYYVQILQVTHGTLIESLRTPRIHKALAALSAAGVLEADEARQLREAYVFLRKLINGLRMLRGHALDLQLPELDEPEYGHLARRMGYRQDLDLSPEQKLHLEFDGHTAVIRHFVERHFGQKAVLDAGHGNAADLVLSSDAPDALRKRVLEPVGFADSERAFHNLKRLAGEGERQSTYAWLAVLAMDMLRDAADVDMALNNWERFVANHPNPEKHYRRLLSQPRRLEILLSFFAGSQFLADTLVRHPEFFDWVTDPKILQSARTAQAMTADLETFLQSTGDRTAWLDAVRRFRRREILRIGARDFCLQAPIEEITSDLSILAEVIIEALLDREWNILLERHGKSGSALPSDRFCVIALGKLGGSELNYSSDIDLLGIYDPADAADPQFYERVLVRLRDALAAYTEEGYAYRVDFRLRPYGAAGPLVQPLSAVFRYYRKSAHLWEVQALLKARPVAGNRDVGKRFVEDVKTLILERRSRRDIVSTVRSMRDMAIQQTLEGKGGENIKTGVGGIRDVEFAVQALQLQHAVDFPRLVTGNTLEAMDRLREAGLIDAARMTVLRSDYVFLRRTEHFIQLLEDRQTHILPQKNREMEALSKRLLGHTSSFGALNERLLASRERVREFFNSVVKAET
jgi:glutamate-ammonia-ligase adenylyltransferase